MGRCALRPCVYPNMLYNRSSGGADMCHDGLHWANDAALCGICMAAHLNRSCSNVSWLARGTGGTHASRAAAGAAARAQQPTAEASIF